MSVTAAPPPVITPPKRRGIGVTIALVVVLGAVVVVGGIGAAIVRPALLRARMSANEASAISSLRMINIAQAAYAASCGAEVYAVSLNDLAKPPAGSSVGFLPTDLATNDVVKAGYRFRVEAVPGAVSVAAAGPCSGAVAGYFAAAEPVTLGETGTRFLSTDAGGKVYGSQSPIANPLRPSPSVTLLP